MKYYDKNDNIATEKQMEEITKISGKFQNHVEKSIKRTK